MRRLAKGLVRRLCQPFLRAQASDPGKLREIWRRAETCCVVSASGIGDSLMATPLVEAIRRSKPGIRLIVICSEKTAHVFRGNPHVDGLYTYLAERPGFLTFLRVLWVVLWERIDVLLGAQPCNTIRHSLIAGLSRARVRLKHACDYSPSRERDFSFVYSAQLPDSMARHRVELNLDLLRFLGEVIPEKTIYPTYRVGGSAHERVQRWLVSHDCINGRRPLVGIHPGGVRPNKRWPPERFAEVGQSVLDGGFDVCLVGGREERALTGLIRERIGRTGVLNAAGEFSLEETAALLLRCRCLVSNDTGIMHLATAVGTPVVAVFGPTDFRHIGPYSNRAKVVFRGPHVREVKGETVLKQVMEVFPSRETCVRNKGIQ